MSKDIWLPASETHVTVKDGKVTVTESMKMYPRPLGKPGTGFGK